VRNKLHITLLFIFSFLFLSTALHSQVDTTKTEKVKVKNADNFITELTEEINKQFFRGNVKIVHDSIFMFCDSATVNENVVTAVGEVTIVQDDTINVFSDSLYYDGDEKVARLFDNVVLKNSGKELYSNALTYHLDTKLGIFRDTAILKSNDMLLSSKRGQFNVKNKMAFFYEEVTIIDGKFKLKADSLRYDTEIDRAYFLGPTYITEGARKVYCEKGYYDIEEGRAFFSNDAIVTENDQVALADIMIFSEQDSTMVLEGNASVKDSVSFAKGEKISIDDKTGDVLIEGNAYYEKENETVQGSYIKYNKKTEDVSISGESLVTNETGYLKGDSISYIKAEDFGRAIGDVLWVDTVENRKIETDELVYKQESKFYKAIAQSRRPLFSQLVEEDTLFLSADTLVSSNPSDSVNFLRAVSSVKIFKTDLQAICDSLYYSSLDSIFQLFKDPVCWSDTTQFSGDTISIQLENDNVSDIIANKNAFVISSDSDEYYNQIKGKYIHSILDSNALKKTIVKGNAESIYMLKDDDEALVGPNKNTCSHMDFHFDSDSLKRIEFFTQSENKMVPMEKTTDADLYLTGFKWRESEKPKDKFAIRVRKFRQSEPVEEEIESKEEKDEFESTVDEIIKSNSNLDSKKEKGKKSPKKKESKKN